MFIETVSFVALVFLL